MFKHAKGEVSVCSTLTTDSVFPTPSKPTVTLLKISFIWPESDTGCPYLVINMENQKYFYETQDELEIQRRSHEPGEQFNSSLAAPLIDMPGNDDS